MSHPLRMPWLRNCDAFRRKSWLAIGFYWARIGLEIEGKGDIPGGVKPFNIVAALLLLAFWVPISSHELLEHCGLIHTQSSNPLEKHEDDHDAADGLCNPPAGAVQVQKLFAVDAAFAVRAVLSDLVRESVWQQASFSLINPSPPEVPVGWQFSSRASLPARAPSYLS